MEAAETQQFLFVVGCPRSGTTAMGRFLAEDVRVVMGIERFGHRVYANDFTLSPALFAKERFMSIEPGDTFYDSFDFSKASYSGVEEKYDDAEWLGDKIPKLYEALDHLFEVFPETTKVIFLFRNIFDVCASYNQRLKDPKDDWSLGTADAIRDWNRSIAMYKKSKHKDKIIPVIYEDFFRHKDNYLAMCKMLSLSTEGETLQRIKAFTARNSQLEEARTRSLSEEDVFKISTEALFGGYRDIVADARALLSVGNPKS